MAVDFLDIAPLEAVEWTVSVKDKDGNDQEVRVFPFDASDLVFMARTYCPRAKSIFDSAAPEYSLDIAEARPYIVALSFLGSARMRDKKTFDEIYARVRKLPADEQVRIYSEIWDRNFSSVNKEDGEADPPTPAVASGDAASPAP